MIKKIDLRYIDEQDSLFYEIVNKRLKSYTHDPYMTSNTVYNRVSLEICDNYYRLENCVEVVDYYGNDEDICVLKLRKIKEDEVKSALADVTQETFSVNKDIKQIVEIIETSSMYEGDEKTYEMIYVKVVILILDDNSQIILERTDDFSESISITKATNIDIESKYMLEKDDEIIDEDVKFVITREKRVIR